MYGEVLCWTLLTVNMDQIRIPFGITKRVDLDRMVAKVETISLSQFIPLELWITPSESIILDQTLLSQLLISNELKNVAVWQRGKSWSADPSTEAFQNIRIFKCLILENMNVLMSDCDLCENKAFKALMVYRKTSLSF